MLVWIIVKSALKSLLANKLRSFLAMLGIIIGVGAVIAMLAIGAGAQASIMERLNALGADNLIVRSGQNRRFRGVSSGEGQNLTLADAEALVNSCPNIKQVAPVATGRAQVVFFNRNTNTTILGTTVTYLSIRNFALERGRSFTEAEVEKNIKVAIIGPATAEELFDQQDPIGETIRIRKTNFKIVGLLKAKGDQGWFNPDDQVIVPLHLAMKQLFGQERLREVNIQANSSSVLQQAQEEVTEVLRRRHRITPPAPDDFNIRNMAEAFETASEVGKTFTYLLGGIASISLLVGGIGIMNIMLVTVTERTREIGIRKSVGAKRRDILRQFLLESILMSGIGGSMGAGMGIAVAWILDRYTVFEPLVQSSGVLLAFGFSCAVGIFFGFYPALRAARLSPVETLRYE